MSSILNGNRNSIMLEEDLKGDEVDVLQIYHTLT